jgi:hypothetical protein
MTEHSDKVASSNKKMAMTLFSIAITFFVAIIIKKMLLG